MVLAGDCALPAGSRNVPIARTKRSINGKRTPAQRTANQLHRCFPAGLAGEADQLLTSWLDLRGTLCDRSSVTSSGEAMRLTRDTRQRVEQSVRLVGRPIMRNFRRGRVLERTLPKKGASSPIAPRRGNGRKAESGRVVRKVGHGRIGGVSPPASCPMLDAGTGPADPGRPADGRIRKIAGPRRAAIMPG